MRRPVLFTLDPHFSLIPLVKSNYKYFKDIFFNVSKIPKIPITSLDQAIYAWGINNTSKEEIESFRKNRLFAAVLTAILLCLQIFFFLCSLRFSFPGILTILEFILAFLPTAIISFICFWQSDVLSDGKFIPFTEYVKKGKWLFSVLFIFSFAVCDHASLLAEQIVAIPEAEIVKNEDLSSFLIASIIGKPWLDFAPSMGRNFVDMSSVLVPLLICLNGMALFFITVFAVYIFSFGSTQIANTGHWSDTQIFSTFWSPVRTTMAIALCSPLTEGVSVLHYLILVAIAASINFANNVSDRFVTYVTEETNMMKLSAPVMTTVEEQYSTLFSTIIQCVVAQKVYTNIIGEELSEPLYDLDNKSKNLTIKFKALPRFTFPIIEVSSQLDSEEKATVEEQYLIGLDDIIKKFYALADTFISPDLKDRRNVSENQIKGTIKSMYEKFSDTIKKINHTTLVASKQDESIQVNKIINSIVSSNNKHGWLMLGTYPFAIAQAQNIIQKHAEIQINVRGSWDSDDFEKAVTSNLQKDELKVINDFYKKIDDAITDLSQSISIGLGKEFVSPNSDNIGRTILSFVGLDLKQILDDFKNGNPISVMYTKGWNIVKMSMYIVTGYGAVTGLAEGLVLNSPAEGAIVDIFGKIVDSSILKGLVGGLSVWTSFIMAVVGMLIMFGVICCYVLPVLPVLYWIRAIVSWAILVVETLLGAPFWAASHIFPEGIGLAGQHARRGYMMIMDVFMRPTLLCCGVIMSMLLLEVIVKIIVLILNVWLHITIDAAEYGGFGYIAISILAIYIIYSAIRFLFVEAIGNFPHHVLVWCGGNDFANSHVDVEKMISSITTHTGMTEKRVESGIQADINKAIKEMDKKHHDKEKKKEWKNEKKSDDTMNKEVKTEKDKGKPNVKISLNK